MDDLIRFIDVTKTFKATEALSKLSFIVKQNECVGLIGNNGCGKTTTINVLCNIIPYEKGDVFIFNKKVEACFVNYKQRLGVLFSPPILVNEFTIREYLKFICRFQKVNQSEIPNRINDLISAFHLNDNDRKVISSYSAGDKMKIALAGALIHNPDILILDEPFVHLDIQTVDFISNVLNSVKSNKTIFITSHNLDLLASVCERFLIMDRGRIIDDIQKASDLSNESIKQMIKESVSSRNTHYDQFSWLK